MTTEISELVAGAASGATDIFADLGSGTQFGAQSVSAADMGTDLMITLNAAALAALNAASDSIAFGGAITTLNFPVTSEADVETVFSFSNFDDLSDTRLILTLPEPSSAVLLALGLAGLGAFMTGLRRGVKA